MSLLTCPWGCGWEGTASEYVEHLETCPKYPEAKKPLTHEEKVHKFLEEEAAREKAVETPVEALVEEPTEVEPSSEEASKVETSGEEAIESELDPEETWLIRDETHVKVEPADKEVAVEEPLETPVEADKK